jgi:hypothetical protein
MAITRHYSREVRHNLSFSPIWQPGSGIAPGDIGRIESGVFVRHGSLRNKPFSIPFKTRQERHANPWQFQSSHVIKGKASAEVAVPKVRGGPKASIDVTFNQEGGVIFHAVDGSRSSIENLSDVSAHVQRIRAEFGDYVFVAHVETAKRFKVLVSEEAGASLKLKGDLSAIEALNVADAAVSVAETRGQIYEQHGNGPILLRLYGFKWWSRRVKPQGMGGESDDGAAERESLQELSPHDPLFDA